MSVRTGIIAAALSVAAFTPDPIAAQAADSAAVAEAVDRFHKALATADTATVEALLHARATVLETGGVETRAEYIGGHMRGDMAFAQAVPRERSDIRVTVMGNTAWAVSTSVTTGRYRDRDIDSQGAELMVLVKEGGQWKIAAVHWSSRARWR